MILLFPSSHLFSSFFLLLPVLAHENLRKEAGLRRSAQNVQGLPGRAELLPASPPPAHTPLSYLRSITDQCPPSPAHPPGARPDLETVEDSRCLHHSATERTVQDVNRLQPPQLSGPRTASFLSLLPGWVVSSLAKNWICPPAFHLSRQASHRNSQIARGR